MPQLPTLFLHPRYDEDSQLVWQEAVNRGWPVIRTDSAALGLEISDPVVYGGYMWAPRIAESLGISLMAPADDWLATADWRLTRRLTMKWQVHEIRKFPVFVKSLTAKVIPSRVYHSRDDLPPGCEDEWVLVQPVVQWEREYRAFVLDDEVRALSLYADHGELRIEPWDVEATYHYGGAGAAYLTSVLRDLELPRACVVDIGEIEGRDWFDRWAVVEPNPAWCSGLYACEPAAALDVIAASCGRMLT